MAPTNPAAKSSNSKSTSVDRQQEISSAHVVLFTADSSHPAETKQQCADAKQLLDSENVLYREVKTDPKVDVLPVPLLYVGGKSIGGLRTMKEKFKNRSLMQLIGDHKYHYDLIVIGGDIGGLAAAKVSIMILGCKYCKYCISITDHLLFSILGSCAPWQESGRHHHYQNVKPIHSWYVPFMNIGLPIESATYLFSTFSRFSCHKYMQYHSKVNNEASVDCGTNRFKGSYWSNTWIFVNK